MTRPPFGTFGVGHSRICNASPLLASFPPTPFARPSLAFGVNQSPDDPDAVASVGGADMASTHHERPAGVARRFQVTEHPVSAVSSEPRDVLNEYPTGSQLAHDPVHFSPQPAAVACFDALLLPRDRHVLAREASGDEIDGPEITGIGEAHVTPSVDVGPVPLKDVDAVGVALDLPDDAHPSPFEAEPEPPDSREEFTDRHPPPLTNPTPRVTLPP
jgi:hypothetical protein